MHFDLCRDDDIINPLSLEAADPGGNCIVCVCVCVKVKVQIHLKIVCMVQRFHFEISRVLIHRPLLSLYILSFVLSLSGIYRTPLVRRAAGFLPP